MAKEAGPQINWVGAAGSGLGSVTSAVLLSTTGAAGTWIGAGIGTFIITVGGAIYAYYLQRAKTGIEKTADKMKKVGGSSRNDTRQDTTSISAQRDPNEPSRAEASTEDAEHTGSEALSSKVKPTFKEALKNIRWKRVARARGRVIRSDDGGHLHLRAGHRSPSVLLYGWDQSGEHRHLHHRRPRSGRR